MHHEVPLWSLLWGFSRLPEGCLWKEGSYGTTAISQLYMNRPQQEIAVVMPSNPK
jgi:hypothetical protein